MTYDAAHKVMLLTGGLGLDSPFSIYLDDTWSWDGTHWTEQHPAQSAPFTFGALMGYHAATGKVMLFTGFPSSTWTWNGVDWTQENPPASPPDTAQATLAPDATGNLMLFGGFNNVAGVITYTQDTWRWDGATWTKLVTPIVPPGRQWAMMAYDPETHEDVLFGGFQCGTLTQGCTNYHDTWTWDGSAWNLRQPSVSPPSISSAAMGYDPTGHRLLIFGGSSVDQQGLSSGVINDTWAWSGANWAHLQTSVTPAGILAPSMATFPPGATVLLFGGQQDNPGRGVSNTWTFIPPILTSVVSRKTHRSAGTFDVDLPLAGPRGIECRSGGANGDYTLVFSFANALTNVASVSASATSPSGPQPVSSSGSIGTDPHQYIVNLTGVPDAQYITVNLANVTDSAGNSSSAVSASMGVLIGDVNGSGVVTSGDTNLCKAQALQPVTSANFRSDINASGAITTGDVNMIKENALSHLP